MQAWFQHDLNYGPKNDHGPEGDHRLGHKTRRHNRLNYVETSQLFSGTISHQESTLLYEV